MRLINTSTIESHEFFGDKIPNMQSYLIDGKMMKSPSTISVMGKGLKWRLEAQSQAAVHKQLLMADSL